MNPTPEDSRTEMRVSACVIVDGFPASELEVRISGTATLYSSWTIVGKAIQIYFRQPSTQEEAFGKWLIAYTTCFHLVGVRTLLALRFTSNHGWQDINPKISPGLGTFPWG